MSNDSQPKSTAQYSVDVGKAIKLLAQHKIVDPDAVVEAFAEVREDAAKAELAKILAWLKKRPCPTPASWAAVLQSLEDHEHRHE